MPGDSIEHHLHRALNLSAIGRGDEALAEARAARMISPLDRRALDVHAYVAIDHADAFERDLATGDYLAAFPDQPEALMHRALHLQHTAREFPDGHRPDPDAASPLDRFTAADAETNLDEAYELALFAYALAPSDDPLGILAVVQMDRGELDDAEIHIDEIRRLVPDQPKAEMLSAELESLRAENRWIKASIKVASLAFVTFGLSLLIAAPLWLVGYIQGRRHRAAATTHANNAVALDPDNPDLLSQLAEMQSRRFQTGPAADALFGAAAADLGGAPDRNVVERLQGLWSTRAFMLLFGLGITTPWVSWFTPGPVERVYGMVAGGAVWLIVVHLIWLRRSIDRRLLPAARRTIDASTRIVMFAVLYCALTLLMSNGTSPDGDNSVWWWFAVVQVPALAVGMTVLLLRFARARRRGARPIDLSR